MGHRDVAQRLLSARRRTRGDRSGRLVRAPLPTESAVVDRDAHRFDVPADQRPGAHRNPRGDPGAGGRMEESLVDALRAVEVRERMNLLVNIDVDDLDRG